MAARNFSDAGFMSLSFPLQVPGTASGAAQQPVGLIVIQNALVHRVPFELAAGCKRKITENGQMRHSHARFDIHDGLFAALDAVLEIFTMAGTAEKLDAAARCYILFGLGLGIRTLPIPVCDGEPVLVAPVDSAVAGLQLGG